MGKSMDKILNVDEVSPEMLRFIEKNAQPDCRPDEKLDFTITKERMDGLNDDEKMIYNAFKKDIINLEGDYNTQEDYNK